MVSCMNIPYQGQLEKHERKKCLVLVSTEAKISRKEKLHDRITLPRGNSGRAHANNRKRAGIKHVNLRQLPQKIAVDLRKK